MERVIDGEESQSTTSIIGDDGRKTVAIVVDYAWHPGKEEVDELVEILGRHGWEEEGAWFQVLDSLDSIVVDHVPVSAILEIHAIESVEVVEMQNVMYPFWRVQIQPLESNHQMSTAERFTIEDMMEKEL